MLRDTVNTRAVRILLECILVEHFNIVFYFNLIYSFARKILIRYLSKENEVQVYLPISSRCNMKGTVQAHLEQT